MPPEPERYWHAVLPDQKHQLPLPLPEQKHHQYLAEKTSASLLTELHDSQPDVRILLVRLAL